MGRASPDWVVVRLALGAAGALAVPCDHLASAEEARRLLHAGGCRRAFVAAEHLPMLRGIADDRTLTIHLLEGEDGELHIAYTYFRRAIKYVGLPKGWIDGEQS